MGWVIGGAISLYRDTDLIVMIYDERKKQKLIDPKIN